MHLYDLVDENLLKEMLDQKFVRFQTHQRFPELRIYNYTESAAFNRIWNDVTLKTRGLIVNHDTGEILARPFDKFFNYGEPNAPRLELDDEVEVTDKLDGSLGITYRLPNGMLMVATRGSFHSGQAVHASIRLSQYNFVADPFLTYMFEIIYPQNRIVLDYDGMDELVLLGARDIRTGTEYAANELIEWPGQETTTYRYKTLREALEAHPRPNAEGYVVYSSEFDCRVKLKQADYIALHKIVTGLTKRRIWENVSEGVTLLDLIELVPDEWHEWLKTTYNGLMSEFATVRLEVVRKFRDTVEALPLKYTRKDFALAVVDYQYRGLLFKILDGGNIESDVWKLIKPEGNI